MSYRLKITEFLKTNNISNEDAYYGNLFLSETYKRISLITPMC